MADRMAIEGPKELTCITVNGSVIVESEEERARKREARAAKRKSRWDTGSANKGQKHVAPGMSTIINMNAPGMNDPKAQEIYLLNLQIRESSVKMGQATLGIPPNPKDRSPSPEPTYNAKGVRTNTRYERTRAKLQNVRNSAITKLRMLDPSYKPPECMNYKNTLLEDRIEVPQEEHPEHNFMGLILGPRGHYLFKLQEKTDCKIIIKGRGTLKQGMTGIRKDGQRFDGLDDPMHISVSGKTPAGTKEAGDFIRKLIKDQVEDPDGPRMIALRAQHMHDLHVLNGTLKEDQLKCLNCGGDGHKSWQCPDTVCITNSTICGSCGGVGHVTRDCKGVRPGAVWNQSAGGEELDSEYSAFLDDMGGGAPKKARPVDKPYQPPMGDLASRLAGKKAGPKLMLTMGSSAPGAASKAARKQSSGVDNSGMVGKSIFGGKLSYINSGYAKQMGIETEREQEAKKHELKYVPTEWKAEQMDKKLAEKHERLMLELEHAKLMAKLQKKRESKVLTIDTPPPPPPGTRPMSGLNIDGPPPLPPGARLRLGPDPTTPAYVDNPAPGPGYTWNGVCWEREAPPELLD